MEFRTFKELLEMAEESKSSLGELSLSAEVTRSDASREEILAKKPDFEGKALDYPLDKTVYPRILVARKGIK